MPFQLSPGVAVVEKDFSAIVPSVSSSVGAFVGAFQWGPVMSPTQVVSENDLVNRFGQPNDLNCKSFFTAANFLSYTNNMLVVRADTAGQLNAVASPSGSVVSLTKVSGGTGYTSIPSITIGAPNISGGIQATASATLAGGGVTSVTIANGGSGYAGTPTIVFSNPQVSGGTVATGTVTISGGAIVSVTITNPGTGYTSAPTATISGTGTGVVVGTVTISGGAIASVTITNPGTGYTSNPTVTITGGNGSGASINATATESGVKINNNTVYLQEFSTGQGTYGSFAAKYPGALGNSIEVQIVDSSSFTGWQYASSFPVAPSTSDYAAGVGGSLDELHAVVIDTLGLWTGQPGTVLETFAFMSKASDAVGSDGTNEYYVNVINAKSNYVWWMDHPTVGTNWGNTAHNTTFVPTGSALTFQLSGGTNDYTLTDAMLENGWALFLDDASYDINLCPLGAVSSNVAAYVINNIAEVRLDCVVFASPQNTDGSPIIGSGTAATAPMIVYRNALPSTSYGVMDSGWKYQYDRYNDKYRFVPLNGDTAGLCARTDQTNDPWFSPAGLNRGQIKNVVKLAVNPTQADRDTLYSAGINPVVTFPGDGTVLFGDKTLLAKPSAFDRINVRRLFIVLEKSIATAAKFQLFEFNDSFTQAQFNNLVTPFLRTVQGRRGITDFLVVCNGTNNTPDVIDANQFVGDIYIKPNRSINFITLNFIAARSSVSFTELAGG
jgi:phage tail sheath protein FI